MPPKTVQPLLEISGEAQALILPDLGSRTESNVFAAWVLEGRLQAAPSYLQGYCRELSS